jgi:hypothetical protein
MRDNEGNFKLFDTTYPLLSKLCSLVSAATNRLNPNSGRAEYKGKSSTSLIGYIGSDHRQLGQIIWQSGNQIHIP